jgi:hypothetical protein
MRMKMKRTLVVVEPRLPTRNIHASVWRLSALGECVSEGRRAHGENVMTGK